MMEKDWLEIFSDLGDGTGLVKIFSENSEIEDTG